MSSIMANRLLTICRNHRIIAMPGHVSRKATTTTSMTPDDLKIIPEESSDPSPKPLIFHRRLKYMDNMNHDITPARQSWVHSFDESPPGTKRGLIELHPKIFGDFPRPDVIADNVKWQKEYRQISWLNLKSVQEMGGHNKKPWPQKGTGRARHGSKRSPQWIQGGWSHGPRGPETKFYMLNFWLRLKGLTSTLSCKHSQNDLIIVDTLEDFPSDDPKELEKYFDDRSWGPSTLVIDSTDLFPRNISLASEGFNHVNLMPVYGLNVYSMLKHETLIMTIGAVEEVEEKIMFHWRREDISDVQRRFKPPPIHSEFE